MIWIKYRFKRVHVLKKMVQIYFKSKNNDGSLSLKNDSEQTQFLIQRNIQY